MVYLLRLCTLETGLSLTVSASTGRALCLAAGQCPLDILMTGQQIYSLNAIDKLL